MKIIIVQGETLKLILQHAILPYDEGSIFLLSDGTFGVVVSARVCGMLRALSPDDDEAVAMFFRL